MRLGVWTACATTLWVNLVFPLMGKKIDHDVLLIAIAFPAVGCLAGLIGGPVGMAAGAFVAVTLPFLHPWPVLPLYVIGIVAAYMLPRIQPMDNP